MIWKMRFLTLKLGGSPLGFQVTPSISGQAKSTYTSLKFKLYIYVCVGIIVYHVYHDIISSYPINSPIYIPMKPGQWLQPVAPQLGSQFKAQDLNWSRVGHRGKNNGDEKHGKMWEKSGNIYGKLHIMVKKHGKLKLWQET